MELYHNTYCILLTYTEVVGGWTTVHDYRYMERNLHYYHHYNIIIAQPNYNNAIMTIDFLS